MITTQRITNRVDPAYLVARHLREGDGTKAVRLVDGRERGQAVYMLLTSDDPEDWCVTKLVDPYNDCPCGKYTWQVW